MLRKPWAFPLYPLFLAAHYPLFLMASDIGMFDAGTVIRPTLLVALAALVLVAAFQLVLRNIHWAGLCAALVVLVFFHFGYIEYLLRSFTDPMVGYLSGTVVLAIVLAVVALIALLARPGPNVTTIGNTIAAVMLVSPLLTLSYHAEDADDGAAHAAPAGAAVARLDDAKPVGTLPSIVHIVLDGYSRQDVLADLYRFDNAPFLDELRRRGFAIGDRTVSPYNQTMMVMASVLSGDYLPAIDPATSPQDMRRRLRSALRRNPVMETLSRTGYETASVDVRYDPVRMTQVDRLLAPHRISNFEMAVLERSLFQRVAQKLGFLEQSLDRDMFEIPYEQSLTSPFFFYLHALAPHPPFDVDEHGNPVAPEGGWRGLADGSHFTDGGDPERQRIYVDGYVAKLKFTNTMVLSYLDRVMKDVPDPKVIIIHGDHGGGLHLDHDDVSRTCLAERFSPLLAMYASDGRLQSSMPPDMNLVNLYRLVFNTYLGTGLPLLPSRSMFANWMEPARQQDVSRAQLNLPCGAPAPSQ